jgi:nitrogen fixation/metabolism regulation signal transduction histidine kinase
MRRRFPLTWRLLVAILLTLAVPVVSLLGLSGYLQHSVQADMEQKIDTTLDMAMNMEQSLLDAALADMRNAAAATAGDPNVNAALNGGGPSLDVQRFLQTFPQADMVLVVDRQGTVLARATSDRTGDRFLLNGLVMHSMETGEPVAYPTLIGPAELAGEGQAIRDLVDMAIVKTADSTDSRVGSRVDTALALAGVAPIRSAGGKVIGSAIAVDVLNRDFRIVDEVSRWAPRVRL